MFVEVTLIAIALGLLVPIAVLLVECTAAFFKGTNKKVEVEQDRPRVAVLVPAHNEENEIGTTIQTILPQLTNQDQLVVIADNCSDNTAKVAREFGVTVIERQEPDRNRRGKGYALDYGLQFIEKEPPEVVVTVDADCIVHQGTITQIATRAIALERPVQSSYIMNQPDNPGLKDQISALAVKVKNLVRPVGLEQMGLPCLLTGSGMAFPWSVIRKISLAGSKTVDDMQSALDLALVGHPPTFCPEAVVTGRLMKEQAAKSQRTRWEHGHIETLFTEVPKLIKAAIAQNRFDLLAMALDLCIPPLSLLVMLWTVSTAAALIAAWLGASLLPAVLLGIEGILLFSAVAGAWAKFGRSDLSMLTLLSVPFYIVWKIPLYLAYLVKPQTKWTRTERDGVNLS